MALYFCECVALRSEVPYLVYFVRYGFPSLTLFILTNVFFNRPGGERRSRSSRRLCRTIETRWVPYDERRARHSGAVFVRRGIPLRPLFEPSQEPMCHADEHGKCVFLHHLLQLL